MREEDRKETGAAIILLGFVLMLVPIIPLPFGIARWLFFEVFPGIAVGSFILGLACCFIGLNLRGQNKGEK